MLARLFAPPTELFVLMTELPHAGQWVDIYLKNTADNQSKELAAGFSMVSNPSNKTQLDFIIKETKHPIVQYIHKQAKEHDQARPPFNVHFLS